MKVRHTQLSLTLDTYSHVVPSLQRDAAKLMNAMLRETNIDRSAVIRPRSPRDDGSALSQRRGVM